MPRESRQLSPLLRAADQEMRRTAIVKFTVFMVKSESGCHFHWQIATSLLEPYYKASPIAYHHATFNLLRPRKVRLSPTQSDRSLEQKTRSRCSVCQITSITSSPISDRRHLPKACLVRSTSMLDRSCRLLPHPHIDPWIHDRVESSTKKKMQRTSWPSLLLSTP